MENVIEKKSFEFAVKIVKMSAKLKRSRLHYELAGQVLRSGTSIGANVAEAQYAQSKKDFVSKLKIGLKEASETEYWLKLLEASEIMMTPEETEPLIGDVKELQRILTAIVNTTNAT